MIEQVYQHPYFGKMNYLLQEQDGECPVLLVFLHGAGERGDDVSLVSLNGIPRYIREGMNIPAVVVCPQCPANAIWSDLVYWLRDFINDIAARYHTQRTVITGLSMGGYGTWAMLEAFPEMFYKGAPICGGGVAWNTGAIKASVWAFHGDVDDIVLPKNSLEMVDALKSAGGDVRLTLFHGVSHCSWDDAYLTTKVIDWLLSE